MKKFTGLRLTLPTLHFDMSEVMQKRSVDMHETFLHNNDVMDAPRISDIADFLSLHNRTEIRAVHRRAGRFGQRGRSKSVDALD